MARIAMIPDDSWDGELGELHPRVVDPTHRRVDNILAVHSLNPRSMAAHQGLYESAWPAPPRCTRLNARESPPPGLKGEDAAVAISARAARP